jgi:SAM-dependent methyltransferase
MPERHSVWPVWQVSARAQRKERILPGSTAHPARMMPELARRLVVAYSQPGDLVLDPMCGIGTTLVEAVHAGRDALGIEYEPRWARLSRQNVAHARAQGAGGVASVVAGDARLAGQLIRKAAGEIALVITSPPYGRSLHGRVSLHGGEVTKFDNRYSEDRRNLGHVGMRELLTGFETILGECRTLVRPGGTVAVTTRPLRVNGRLIDLPGGVVAAGTRVGLVPHERLVALLCGLRGDGLVSHHTFFALENVRRARRRGQPVHLIAHEDVIVFRVPSLDGDRRGVG